MRHRDPPFTPVCVYMQCATRIQPYVSSILSLPRVTDAILTYGFRGGRMDRVTVGASWYK